MVGAPLPPVPAEEREGAVVWMVRARWAASWRGIRDDVRVMRAMAPAANGREMLMRRGVVELWDVERERLICCGSSILGDVQFCCRFLFLLIFVVHFICCRLFHLLSLIYVLVF